jgi:hypothetical protein
MISVACERHGGCSSIRPLEDAMDNEETQTCEDPMAFYAPEPAEECAPAAASSAEATSDPETGYGTPEAAAAPFEGMYDGQDAASSPIASASVSAEAGPVKVSSTAEAGYGTETTEAGDERTYVGANAKTVGVDVTLPNGALQANGPSASVGFDATEYANGGRSFNANVQANAGDASVTAGDEYNSARVGVSAGAGFGARGGYANQSDGTTTYSAGVDVGPFSGDVKFNPDHARTPDDGTNQPVGSTEGGSGAGQKPNEYREGGGGSFPSQYRDPGGAGGAGAY